MKVSDFFDSEMVDYATYDSFRSIASVVDGLKPSARKILYTVGKQNITDLVRVSQLASSVSLETLYTHGEVSLWGVIDGLAQNFPGSNNLTFLASKGFFGDRCDQTAGAPRYIYVKKSPNYDKVFLKDDRAILINQIFEGEQIEPKFLLPTLPLILLNGSEGIGNGFAQKILSRDINDLLNAIRGYIRHNKLPKEIKPSFNGFKGSVTKDPETGSWLIAGKFERVDRTTIKITELPIGYELDKYLGILDDLEEKKIIKEYKDWSEGNDFKFTIKTDSDFPKLSDEKILEKLKLIRRISENFTCINENNKIIEFKNEIEVLKEFIDVRLKYYQKRKDYILARLIEEGCILAEKVKFIKMILDGKLTVQNKTKKIIEEALEAMSFVKVDDSYNYLLSMQIYTLTKEKFEELKEQMKEKRAEYEELNKTTIETIWENELNTIKR